MSEPKNVAELKQEAEQAIAKVISEQSEMIREKTGLNVERINIDIYTAICGQPMGVEVKISL